MINPTIKTLTASLLLTSVFSSEVGVGFAMSPQEDTKTILIPIKFKSLCIEPYGSIVSVNYDNRAYKTEQEGYEFGVGFFGIHNTGDTTNIYYGGRISYTKAHGKVYGESYYVQESEYETEGYIITPTFGFEYYPIPKLSIGGEIGYKYQTKATDQDNLISGYDKTSTDIDEETQGTVTKLIVRYFL